MNNSQALSNSLAGQTIILSIKPKYAERIITGVKTVEFRRVWAAQYVQSIAIYASAPIQRIIGFATVSEVVLARPKKLWSYCTQHNAGLSRKELLSYFDGKEFGFAIVLGETKRFGTSIDPRKIVKDFSPPQSFRYMTTSEMSKLMEAAGEKEP